MGDVTRMDAAIDCIEVLASDIARAAPDCSDKAMRILDLVRDLRGAPDRSAVRDAIELDVLDIDASQTQVEVATSAVLKAVKNSPL